MALTCPIGLDVEKLREEIGRVYTRVAESPQAEFHFHRGPEYAVRLLGYREEDLAALPVPATASFAGVGNPFVPDRPPAGATVVDVGSGAGTDTLLAAMCVGPGGRVIGVDPTEAMRARAWAALASWGHPARAAVEFRAGSAEDLPVASGSADVVISNGVVNLTSDKELVFREILRVLSPGGRLRLSDIVVASELSERTRSDIDLWIG
jgi:SAM-dependent methyltransferase